MEDQSLPGYKRRRVQLNLGLILLGLASLPAQPPAETMRISTGIADRQVVQRGSSGTAAIEVSGTAPPEANGVVRAAVRHAGKLMPGLENREIGKAQAGKWSASLKAIPTGGPYRIEFSVRDPGGRSLAAVAVDEVLVGDLWLLAGQSNMQGVGLLENVEPPTDKVHSFDLGDRWVVASEPLHRLLEAVDPVYWRDAYSSREERERAAAASRAKETKGAGLGLSVRSRDRPPDRDSDRTHSVRAGRHGDLSLGSSPARSGRSTRSMARLCAGSALLEPG